MYDNIIYDFDGTVADSYPYFTRALKLTLEHYGKEDTYESILANLKISVRHALRHYAFPDRAEAKKMMVRHLSPAGACRTGTCSGCRRSAQICLTKR